MITVKQARILSDLSQRDMAEKLGVHVQTYRKIEINPEAATVRQAKEIAKITGRSYDEIFFSKESTKSRDNASDPKSA